MQAFVLAAFTAMPIALINGFSPLFERVIVFTAEPFPIFVSVSVLLFLLVRRLPGQDALAPLKHIARRVQDVGVVSFAAVATWIASVVLKNYYQVLRPAVADMQIQALFVQTDFGFPSGHTAVFTALAIMLFFVSRRAGILASVAALLIACARVLSGVHTPLDIFGGFLLGFSISILIGYGVSKLTRS